MANKIFFNFTNRGNFFCSCIKDLLCNSIVLYEVQPPEEKFSTGLTL